MTTPTLATPTNQRDLTTPTPAIFKGVAGEMAGQSEGQYINEEHEKGRVDVAVAEDFHDLSLEHQPLGTLCSQIKVEEIQEYYDLLLF